MGEKTNISWTESSWNPVTGCSKVSEGCRHCYAETLSLRMGWSQVAWTAPNAARNVVLHPDRLELPLKWRKPRMIFVNSMSDLFHELVPDEFINQVFETMRWAQHHTFQVLTKRPERMAAFVAKWEQVHFPMTGMGVAMQHVWLGTSVEAQREADIRIPHLLATPAAVHFLSCEPLLGPLNLHDYLWEAAGPGWAGENPREPGIGWVIVGGESGSHLGTPGNRARWMHLDWSRSLRDQCVAAGVPFFFKQQSGVRPGMYPFITEEDGSHTEWHQFPAGVGHAEG